MKLLLGFVAVALLGCGGNGGGSANSATWTGSLDSIPGGTPIPGGSATLDLTVKGESVQGSCSIPSRSETGTCAGTLRDGYLSIAVDFPTSADWVVHGDSRYQSVSFAPDAVSGRILVDSQEFTRTVHVYQADVQLARR